MIERKKKISRLKEYPVRVIAKDKKRAEEKLLSMGYENYDPNIKSVKPLANSTLSIYEFGKMIDEKINPKINDYTIKLKLSEYKL